MGSKGRSNKSTPFFGTLKSVAGSAWRSASCRSSPKQPNVEVGRLTPVRGIVAEARRIGLPATSATPESDGAMVIKGEQMAPVYLQYGCGFSVGKDRLNFDNSPTLRIERLPVIGNVLGRASRVILGGFQKRSNMG